MKKILAALLISSLAPIAMAEVNQNNESPKFEHRKEMKERFNKELGITQDQLDQIKSIKEKYKGDREKERAEIEAVFTPEQKAKLSEMKSNHKDKRHKGKNHPPVGAPTEHIQE